MPIQMRVYGLGTRYDVEPLHVIPVSRSKPSVIGFYHGHQPLDMEFLTKYLLFECRRLHPLTDPDDPLYLTDPDTGESLEKRHVLLSNQVMLG